MELGKKIELRISELCSQCGKDAKELLTLCDDGEIQIEDLEAVCEVLKVSLADFFNSPLFRTK